MLTWKQRMQRYIKRQKKKTFLHTSIATVCLLIFIPAYSLLTSPDSPPSVNKDPQDQLTLTMVGDMMFGRYIDDIIVPNKGYDYFFHYVAPYFKASDYVTGNFEHPILLKDPEKYQKKDKSIHLFTREKVTEALKKANFSTVNLANNHMTDYGNEGLQETLLSFSRAGIDAVGAGRDAKDARKISIKEVNGVRIATIGISDTIPKGGAALKNRPGVGSADPKVFIPLVAKAKSSADLVIVHCHWGVEYDSGYHPRQQAIGRALIDAGADIVVGHHPHVLEPIEVYKNGVIFYSLGNFIFDQGWSRTRESVLAQYKIRKDGTVRLELHPMYIREGQPRPVTGWTSAYRREKIFNQLTEETMYTSKWDQVWKREGDKLVRDLKHIKLKVGGQKNAS
ncbi:CapA family protein [Thermoflavimicrobium dichotomicum]|uniref:Poly-gamma-glutamate synthesis protein (Capsule biosynthesis protein) n=1 Tax=Thermoflavimicrobium dichotomicum TaxID=46223 RepID=A0A1I3JM29_9BACL|nr:CapA family protein [Thermoflavimicrobium dichotomicum]SFI61216.1 poly-gamma-glutamate synthesis protein (capsule biosynthesis protein) [Thermoflavimicrobium dichotomicum]